MPDVTKEYLQMLGDEIDSVLQAHTQNENVHFCLMVIDMGVQPVKATTISSLPRDLVLKLWKDEIEGRVRVTVDEVGPRNDN